jgi:hypothetical protein
MLLVAFLESVAIRRAEVDASLGNAVSAWNDFGDRGGSFADAHSTLNSTS